MEPRTERRSPSPSTSRNELSWGIEPRLDGVRVYSMPQEGFECCGRIPPAGDPSWMPGRGTTIYGIGATSAHADVRDQTPDLTGSAISLFAQALPSLS